MNRKTRWEKRIFAFAGIALALCPSAMGFDLTRLQKFNALNGVGSPEQLGELIGFYCDELTTPSQPQMGVGGGPIDSGYIREVILCVIGQAIAPTVIEAQLKGESAGEIHDMLTVAAGLAQPGAHVDRVAQLAQTSPKGFMRHAAAMALVKSGDACPTPLLEHLMDDPYSRLGIQDVGGPQVSKVYPVRQCAGRELARRGQPSGRPTEITLTEPTLEAQLAALLSDREPEVCLSVITILGRLGSPAALAHIETFVSECGDCPPPQGAVAKARSILKTQRAELGNQSVNGGTMQP